VLLPSSETIWYNLMELLSLFCGPGGLDQGFKDAGYETTLAFDIDEECVRTYNLNHVPQHAYIRDITTLSIDDLDMLSGKTYAPDGVIGGPPCQSFSVSNVYQSEKDPRNSLPESYAKLLDKLNKRHPIKFFLFENVPGLLSKKHIYRYNSFKHKFENAGFKIYETLLDAKDYDVPQERQRIFIVGINVNTHKDLKWSPPKPINTIRTVRDTIGHLPEPVFNTKGLNPATFPVHPNHWCMVPRSTKFTEKKLEEGQMYGRSFRTLWWDRPSWTVAYGHREVHVHPKGHRRLSIYEAMLLQTFPESYRLTGNISAQIRLVSEAVPVRLAWHLAKSIKDAFEKH
jgi:DNA (cytosine-5)-methyltransferase 1